MQDSLDVTLRAGLRVKTSDTKRSATVLEVFEPFRMAFLRYDNGQEDWWPFSHLEVVATAPDRSPA